MRSFKAIIDKDFISTMFADNYNSYWAKGWISKDTPTELRNKAEKENKCTEDVWADILLGGGCIVIYDIEEDKEHRITLKEIESGLKILTFNYPRQYANIMTHEYDFWDVDALLQCVVFKDVIYG